MPLLDAISGVQWLRLQEGDTSTVILVSHAPPPWQAWGDVFSSLKLPPSRLLSVFRAVGRRGESRCEHARRVSGPGGGASS